MKASPAAKKTTPIQVVLDDEEKLESIEETESVDLTEEKTSSRSDDDNSITSSIDIKGSAPAASSAAPPKELSKKAAGKRAMPSGNTRRGARIWADDSETD